MDPETGTSIVPVALERLDQDAAHLALLCEGCACVDRLIEQELDAVSQIADDAQRQDAAEALIAFGDWMRVRWVAFAQQLEQTR